MPAAIQQSQMESDRLSAIKTIDSEIRAIEELKKSLDAESLTKALDFMQNSTGRIITVSYTHLTLPTKLEV